MEVTYSQSEYTNPHSRDGLFLNRKETDVTSFLSPAVILVSTLFLMYVFIHNFFFRSDVLLFLLDRRTCVWLTELFG